MTASMVIGAAAQRRPKEQQIAALDYELMRASGIDPATGVGSAHGS